MKEYLRLSNGTEFALPVNAIREARNTLHLSIIVPEDKGLLDIKALFSDKQNTQNLVVVKDGKVIRCDAGYVVLGSRIILDDNAAVGVTVTENEDGTTTSETEYACVAELELSKETLESKVESNRADIDYLLMMEE